MKVELREDRDVRQHDHDHHQVEVEREVPSVGKLDRKHLRLRDSEMGEQLWIM